MVNSIPPGLHRGERHERDALLPVGLHNQLQGGLRVGLDHPPQGVQGKLLPGRVLLPHHDALQQLRASYGPGGIEGDKWA